MTKADIDWNKKSHIKMLIIVLFDCAIIETAAVLIEDGTFALFFVPIVEHLAA